MGIDEAEINKNVSYILTYFNGKTCTTGEVVVTLLSILGTVIGRATEVEELESTTEALIHDLRTTINMVAREKELENAES